MSSTKEDSNVGDKIEKKHKNEEKKSDLGAGFCYRMAVTLLGKLH